MKKEVIDFFNGLDEEDIKELKEVVNNRKHRKWIFRSGHYIIKGTIFLIASWITFETFVKQIFVKIIH